MYVRIARFEGGSPDTGLKMADEVRNEMEAVRRGEKAGSMPPEFMEAVSRLEMLVDRRTGASAMAVYCETEDEVRRVDAILNGMSPQGSDSSHRVSADIYEVVLDETTRIRRVA